MMLHHRINALAGEIVAQMLSDHRVIEGESCRVIRAICERHIKEILRVELKRTKKHKVHTEG